MCDYYSDVLRNIKKFDIYTCDFGDHPGLTTLGKARPCVIVQSDDLNSPISKSFIVAPIRSEHSMDVIDENDAKDCVDMRKKCGRLYIPIKVSKKDKDMISFIDITQTRQVDASKLDRYIGQIVKPEIRMQINSMLMQLFFSKDECIYEVKEEDDIDIVEERCEEITYLPEAETKEGVPTLVDLHPTKSDNLIGNKINKAISEASKANEQKIIDMHKKVKRKEISKSTAAKKLGLTIKAYDEIIKQFNKEEQDEKKPSKYATRPLPKTIPVGFSLYVKQYDDGKLTAKQISKKIGKSEQTVYNYIARYRQLQDENKKVVTSM